MKSSVSKVIPMRGHGPASKRRHIVMLVENNYPSDNRVRNEANLLYSTGYRVSVIALRGSGQSSREVVDGVEVYRIPRVELFKKTLTEEVGLFQRIIHELKVFAGYAFEYAYFTTACFLLTALIFFRHNLDAIHAHNPPDTLFLVALPFKLLGKRFVFDHHDLCPELYRSRYESDEGLSTSMLRLAEWCTFRTADMTIATNESYKRVQIERGKRDPRTIFIVRNGPSIMRMNRVPASQRLRAMNKTILVYIGSLNPQDGVDYLLRALYQLRYGLKREDFYCVIMGSGDSLDDLRKLAGELRLEGYAELTGYVSDEDLQANLAAADICVDPDPSSPLNDVSTWIKIMEYMAYAKPIVSFDLPETRFSAQEAACYVKPNNEADFARAVATIADDPEVQRKMGQFGRRRVEEQLQWAVVGKNLITAYESIGLFAHANNISAAAESQLHERTAFIGDRKR